MNIFAVAAKAVSVVVTLLLAAINRNNSLINDNAIIKKKILKLKLKFTLSFNYIMNRLTLTVN